MELFNPKVSIIIPVYNGANYLREAIDSALAQTYKNIEIIVVNDGSNDNGKTESIILSYGNKIRYFSKPNGGVATALNLGIEKMTGEYFSWLSHDDVYYENKLEIQIGYLNHLQNKRTILYGGWSIIDRFSNIIGEMQIHPRVPLNYLKEGLYPVLNGFINGCTLLVPKECFIRVGMFNPNLRTTQDYALWFEFFKRYPVFFHKDILLKSRSHSEQGSLIEPNCQKEANKLWIYFIENVQEQDIAANYHTLPAFYYAMAKRLKSSFVPKAYQYALQKMKNLHYPIKVSIVLPTYNRDWCITEALDSIFKQDFKGYEIIVIDDGSTDQTENVLKAYHDKITYVYQGKKGVAAARNEGIRRAKGEYIAFIDSDDLWIKEHLKEHIRVLDEHIEYGMTYNFANVISQDNKMIGEYSIDLDDNYYPALLYINPTPITTPSVVIRKCVLEELGGFDENMDMCEDIDLWRRVARRHSIKCIPHFLTIVRTRSNQFDPNLYFIKRKRFLEKAISEDNTLTEDSIRDLYLELYRTYYLAGCKYEIIFEDLINMAAKYNKIGCLLRNHIVSMITTNQNASQNLTDKIKNIYFCKVRKAMVQVIKKVPFLYNFFRLIYWNVRRVKQNL